MEKILEKMLITIASLEDYYSDLEDLQQEYKNILWELENTINCPSNWRSIKENLQEKYANDSFLLDIIGD